MEKDFIDILKKLIKEQGKEALTNPAKCKSLLRDYAKNEFKKETHNILRAVEAGTAKEIDKAADLADCKRKLIRDLQEEQWFAPEFAADIVNTLALVLRGDKTVTEAAIPNVGKQATKKNNDKEENLDKKYDEAFAHFKAERYAEAVSMLENLVKHHHVKAQFLLGRCHYLGKGVTKNLTEAVKWLRKAADQGHAYAQNNLGICYMVGEGVAKDDAEAFKWFLKSANQGVSEAQLSVGNCYWHGQGVEQNYAEAAKWLHKAAEQGDAIALQALEILVREGKVGIGKY